MARSFQTAHPSAAAACTPGGPDPPLPWPSLAPLPTAAQAPQASGFPSASLSCLVAYSQCPHFGEGVRIWAEQEGKPRPSPGGAWGPLPAWEQTLREWAPAHPPSRKAGIRVPFTLLP